jgi:hypothetical protein
VSIAIPGVTRVKFVIVNPSLGHGRIIAPHDGRRNPPVASNAGDFSNQSNPTAMLTPEDRPLTVASIV